MTHHHWYGQDQDWCHVCWNASLGMQASWIRSDGFIPANRVVFRLKRGGRNLLIGSAIPQASKHAMKHAPKRGRKSQPNQDQLISSSLLLVWCSVCSPYVGRANLFDNQTQKDFPPEPFWSFLMSHFALLFVFRSFFPLPVLISEGRPRRLRLSGFLESILIRPCRRTNESEFGRCE